MPRLAPHRLTLGPVFSEASRRLWLEIQRRGWSQTRLKKELGAHDGAVTRWLYGDRKPGLQKALRVQEVLDIDPALWGQKPAQPFTPPALEHDGPSQAGCNSGCLACRLMLGAPASVGGP